ncbi:hypothetical protein IAU60_000373 [Kwoniella sp. DSM 27419]
MQSLIGGADCGTSSNPLKQVAQREGIDNSLFKDRHGPSSGPSAQLPFRSAARQAQPSPAHAIHVNPTPHPFNLSHLSAALSQPSQLQAPDLDARLFDARWNHAHANGQQAQIPSQARLVSPPPLPMTDTLTPQYGHTAWSSDFQTYSSGKGKGRAIEESGPVSAYQQQAPYQNGYQQRFGYQPTFTPSYSGAMSNMPMSAAHGQIHPDMTQKEMDDLFARAEEDWRAADQAAETSTGDQKDQDRPDQAEVHDRVEPETVREPKGDFDAVWESLRPEAERLGKLAEWERDFSQFTNDEDDLFDTLNDSLNRPEADHGEVDQHNGFEGISMPNGFEQDGSYRAGNGVPEMREYEYGVTATHDSTALSALWAEANHLLSSGGSLSTAASMLESFLRRATAQDHTHLGVSSTEAWSLLGRVHAMDEKEDKALRAFEQGRKALEKEGVLGKEAVAGEMLTNLAISYVNESLDLAALSVLHQFLRLLHPTFAGQDPAQSALNIGDTTSPWVVHQEVTDKFLALAREQYRVNNQVDPDVQVGLGTLYYMMGEYERSRECWVAALGERPDDYLMWNRLGATLANGGSSEEAVDAYRRALEIKPMFTRAVFNLGVACLNIGVYKEAAEHFLAALSLHPAQSSSEGDPVDTQSSSSLWMTLRRALIALDLPELAERSRPGTDLDVFRQAGFDF